MTKKIIETFDILEWSLCDRKGIKSGLDGVTFEICPINDVDICEVFVKEGSINGVDISTCGKYCVQYGLECKVAYDDKAGSCVRKNDNALDCSDEFTGRWYTDDLICTCGNRHK